jgi:putative FmdB family regulatory protein
MPTYEYSCKSCGEHLEVVQSFKDDALTECPTCGGDLRKVFGSIGIVFKGSGFYKNDSRAGHGSSKPAAAEPGGGSDTAAAASGGDSKSAAAESTTAKPDASPAPAAVPAAAPSRADKPSKSSAAAAS